MMETEEEEEEEEKDAGIPDSSSTARGLARDDASSRSLLLPDMQEQEPAPVHPCVN